MKVRYVFDVASSLRLEDSWDVCIRGRDYCFLLENNRLKSISITIKDNDRSHWPTITVPPAGRAKAHINAGTRKDIDTIIEELRTFQGSLSLYTFIDIDFNHFLTEWLPETDEERNALDFNNIKLGKTDFPKTPLPYNIVVRSLLCADDLKEDEIPLSFFKRGMLDFDQKLYIQAIHNFYFFLETLFANGKFKKEGVLAEFRKSQMLLAAVSKNRNLFLSMGKENNSNYLRFYEHISSNRDVGKILESIVETRGFLHHHTRKRRDTWHPEKQDRFRPEAIFLSQLCHDITSIIVGGKFFNERYTEEYHGLSKKSGTTFRVFVLLQVRYESGEERTQRVRVTIPGTKETHGMAEQLAREAFKIFDSTSASCNLIGFDVVTDPEETLLCSYRNAIRPI